MTSDQNTNQSSNDKKPDDYSSFYIYLNQVVQEMKRL